MSMKIHCDLGQAIDKLSQIEALAREDAAVSAVAAMANVLYEEVRLRAPVMPEPKMYKGKLQIPGALQRAIYRTFIKAQSMGLAKVYEIGWNVRKAPHGHLVEFGHWSKSVGKHGPLKPKWVPAHPFLRPAIGQANVALAAGQVRFAEKMRGVL